MTAPILEELYRICPDCNGEIPKEFFTDRGVCRWCSAKTMEVEK